MAEKNLDFDSVIERTNTYSIKYDAINQRGMQSDVLPLWVADMDFKTSSFVQEALKRQVEHGVFGYSDMEKEYFKAVSKWMKEHYNWKISEQWLIKVPGIVMALAIAVKAFTAQGEGVLIQQPVYHPFYNVISDNGRKVVSSTLYLGEDNRYHIDFEDFENKIIEEKIKLFFLCNPHNPVGRVWSKDELIRMGDICIKHDVLIVSDEIHADFIFQGEHCVFADLKKEFEENTITCTSPSKTFNLAGLQVSNILIANPKIRKLFSEQVEAIGYGHLTVMGLIAGKVAYEQGEVWYQKMHEYVKDNIEYTKTFVGENIENVEVMHHEGTYLLWMDFRKLGLSASELDDLLIDKARVWLNNGKIFGESGVGFQRINVACPRVVLAEALNRIKEAI